MPDAAMVLVAVHWLHDFHKSKTIYNECTVPEKVNKQIFYILPINDLQAKLLIAHTLAM